MRLDRRSLLEGLVATALLAWNPLRTEAPAVVEGAPANIWFWTDEDMRWDLTEYDPETGVITIPPELRNKKGRITAEFPHGPSSPWRPHRMPEKPFGELEEKQPADLSDEEVFELLREQRERDEAYARRIALAEGKW